MWHDVHSQVVFPWEETAEWISFFIKHLQRRLFCIVRHSLHPCLLICLLAVFFILSCAGTFLHFFHFFFFISSCQLTEWCDIFCRNMYCITTSLYSTFKVNGDPLIKILLHSTLILPLRRILQLHDLFHKFIQKLILLCSFKNLQIKNGKPNNSPAGGVLIQSGVLWVGLTSRCCKELHYLSLVPLN